MSSELRRYFLSDQLKDRVQLVFGLPQDPMEALEERASGILQGEHAVVWECEASSFQFSFVSQSAAELFGYPIQSWLEPGFWSNTVVHPDDRNDVVAFCALTTAQCRDHDFEYRGLRADGQVLWIHDIVKVVVGPKGVPSKLRGIMLDITPIKSGETDAG